MDCNVFNIEIRRIFRFLSALALFIMSVASCTKGSREVPLRPKSISIDSGGGSILVHTKFYMNSLSVFQNSYNYTDRIGDELILDYADLSDSYSFNWITINFIDDASRNSFVVQADKNDTGKERTLLLAVYSLDSMYSLSEIRQR